MLELGGELLNSRPRRPASLVLHFTLQRVLTAAKRDSSVGDDVAPRIASGRALPARQVIEHTN